MMYKNWFSNRPEWIFYIFGICIFGFGFYYAFRISLGWASILVSVGLAFIAGGISKKSQMMTEAIAQSTLYETIGVLEDRRLGIKERFEKIQKKIQIIPNYRNLRQLQIDSLDYHLYYSYSIWKCWTYLDRAMVFKKNFTDVDEDRLIHYIDCFFQDLCIGKQSFGVSLIGVGDYIGNLRNMYDIISHFNVYNRDTVGDQLRRTRIHTNFQYLNNLAAQPIYGF
ncbi:MAG: hypothetical protein JW840_09225 [Candidatus Thermoplasmatota archaeon]|nr:hypothetical protein [Candidatus Thermoplasmatota archaeon]